MDASGCDWTQPLATCENPVHDAVHFGFCIGGKLLLINELEIGCCSLRPLQIPMQKPLTPTSARGFLFSGFTA